MSQAGLPHGVTVFERGWLSSNNILCVDGHSSVLIDSGYATHADQTVDLVRGALGSRPLDVLVNTHLHSDHCGGNAALQMAYPLLRTLVPEGQAELVAVWDTVGLTYEPTGQQCPRFDFTGVIRPGTTINMAGRPWEVHASAGHDPHSVVIFEPSSRTLISADALWENGFGVVFPELEREGAFAEVSTTLDLIEQLSPLQVIPGHGRVFEYEEAVMRRARSRLADFENNPERHASHAAKVLLKFKLLEHQQISRDDLFLWMASTPYVVIMHQRFFAEKPMAEWVNQLCDDLVRRGAASTAGSLIFNA